MKEIRGDAKNIRSLFSGTKYAIDAEFKKSDLDARRELYRALAEHIWYPEELLRRVER